MVRGTTEDGPLIRPVDPVSTATIIVLCIAGVILVCAAAMTWWLCRRRREHTKLNSDKSLAFRPPHRKPTAVKSPGSNSHYLKKSPSPTGPAKSPPGSGGQTPSPTGTHSPNPVSQTKSPQPAGDSPDQALSSKVGFTVANERDKAEIENTEKVEREKGCSAPENKENKNNNLGLLVFKLRYLREKSVLLVTVVKCIGLPARGQQNSYVKLQLLPEKEHRVKTRFVRNTTDPVYDEEFTFFRISRAELQKISLHFIVMSFDKYSRDSIIGELTCALASVKDLEDATDHEISQKICPRGLKIQSQGRGMLLVSFCWHPAKSRLTVVVLKACNLPKMDVTGIADPYVKIYLLCNSLRIAKKKTHVKKGTLDPVFNESFEFDIPRAANNLSNISLEFRLLDWDRLTKNEVIGRLEFGGPNCEGTALSHWNEVCNSPRRQIAEWHNLRE